MAVSEPLVAENPFRLLGIGSETPYASLRRQADALARKVQAGLPHDPPLSEWFGQGCVEDLSSQVRSLALDGEKRTILRLMWPFQAGAMCLLGEPDRAIPRLKPYGRVQAHFLSSWIDFVQTKSPAMLNRALTQAKKLSLDLACEDFLSALLAFEEDIDHSTARKLVQNAKTQITKHLLHRSEAEMEAKFRAGSAEGACNLASTILESYLGELVDQRGIDTMVEIGKALAFNIELTAYKTKGEVPKLGSRPPSECNSLTRLANAIGSRDSMAASWQTAIEKCYEELAWRMRTQALILAKNKQTVVEARELIFTATGLTRNKALFQSLTTDLVEIDALVWPLQPDNQDKRMKDSLEEKLPSEAIDNSHPRRSPSPKYIRNKRIKSNVLPLAVRLCLVAAGLAFLINLLISRFR